MRVMAGFVAAGLAALIVAAAVTLSGVYDVAATKPHFAIIRWWLELGMRRSVQFHAASIAVPRLGDPAQVTRGFRHVQTGCLICHSARGLPLSPTVWRLQPAAPDLAETAPTWAPNELFWIVKHGIKMTGMPAWEAQQRDDEVWDVVAFLQALPGLAPAQLEEMSRRDESEAAVRVTNGRLVVLAGPPQKAEAACVRCHGLDGAGHPNGAFPRLSGLDESYLLAALRQYAGGVRPSGFMAPVARALSEEEMRLVAKHYAAMPARGAPSRPAEPALLQQGAALAAAGAPARGIAACVDCHGHAGVGTRRAPALAGQYADYVSRQLSLWKTGRRHDPDDVMGRIARRMTEADIRAAASYFAALPGESAVSE